MVDEFRDSFCLAENLPQLDPPDGSGPLGGRCLRGGVQLVPAVVAGAHSLLALRFKGDATGPAP
ncbi:hypothetical protein E2C01_026026 [Portunus trituberculatus]|uniref:Uncharacterized protein n=1 Tax=Portunus trituberculatus TaxID=210409 RepID=A0A5B7EEP1_PORTR|nr:hypothetical protein [Portunus trituberculatus]